jgi:hypothetical protein
MSDASRFERCDQTIYRSAFISDRVNGWQCHNI